VSGPSWANGARGALSLSFDNLGEAAEIELGAIDPSEPREAHRTVTEVLPSLLDRLDVHALTATFFVEGLNAELYPDALRQIAARGHEVGYHAWRHEQWADLSADQQADNLALGVEAFRRLGLDLAGLRPPGGGLGPGGTALLREAGLRYCSPAGRGVGLQDGVALLPFQWRHVDASCVLPPLAAVREQMTGSPDPLDPAAFVAFLERELTALAANGGQMTIVLHPFMLDWLGEERLDELLDRVADAAARDQLWVAPCERVAAYVLEQAERFDESAVLDTTSWADQAR
jgi:peptidoglycan/xylan/chitin deacetylase (PgdA/CDA1 family)